MNIEEMLRQQCWIVDILPQRVPECGAERYARVEQFYLSEPQIRVLRRRQADILLRLNCYYEMQISSDYGETENACPEPLAFVDLVIGCVWKKCLYIRLSSPECLIVLDGCDTYMSAYATDAELLSLLNALAGSEGLFVWKA